MALVLLMSGIAVALDWTDLNAHQDGVTEQIQSDAWGQYYNPDESTGTGVFAPFLRTQSSSGLQHGYNSDEWTSGLEYETKTDPHTHSLLLGEIPIVDIDGNGTMAYEIVADWNEPNSADEITLEQLEMFCVQSGEAIDGTNIGTYGYPYGVDGFQSGTDSVDAVWGEPWFQLSDGSPLMLLDHNTGSGHGDFKLFVDVNNLPSGCETDDHIVVWTGWDEVSGGFTEWGLLTVPTVDVVKTLDITWEDEYSWSIDKKVKLSSDTLFEADDAAEVVLFDGGSALFDYQVDVNQTYDKVNWAFSGEITVSEAAPPNKGRNITLEDTLTYPVGDDDGTSTVHVDITACDNGTITGGIAIVQLKGSPASVTCQYSGVLPQDFNPDRVDEVFNTVDASYLVGKGNNVVSEAIEYSAIDTDGPASAGLSDVSDPETVTVDDDMYAGVSDAPDATSVSVTTTFDYSVPRSCSDVVWDGDTGSKTIVNTASLDIGASDDASAQVTCYKLGITKDVTPEFTRTWDWSIDKKVKLSSDALFEADDAAEAVLFDGGSTSFDYQVVATNNGSTDSGHQIDVTVTVTNPAPVDATGVAIDDGLAGIDLSCDWSTAGTVPAGGTVTCTADDQSSSTDVTTNTAKVTVAATEHDSAIATWNWNTPTDKVDEEVIVDDDTYTSPGVSGAPDGITKIASTTTFDYSVPRSCSDVVWDGDTGSKTIVNTASLDIGASDDASAQVTCYKLGITKDVTPEFTRTWDWSIDKKVKLSSDALFEADDAAEAVLFDGGSTSFDYQVVATNNGSTDSGHQIDVTVTVTNPAPVDATGVAIDDGLAGIDLSCDWSTAGTVPAGGTVTCTADDQSSSTDVTTNTAKVTVAATEHDSAIATWNWNTPTDKVDETVAVKDIFEDEVPTDVDLTSRLVPQPATVTWTGEGQGATFTLTTILSMDLQHIPDYQLRCGENIITNNVELWGDGTLAPIAVDDDTVVVNVLCAEACTLTQGYWKTHSAAGPKGWHDEYLAGDLWKHRDETWDSLPVWDGSAWIVGDETSMFFLSGQKYWEVQWTAPKGNAYYNLAHQYIAAKLNVVANSGMEPVPPLVAQAIADAEGLFTKYTPDEASALKGKKAKEWRDLASLLGSFNEGGEGWAHCDEVPDEVINNTI
ncbi:MAG: hypothetical protein U9R51_10530 [Actinomycetota bacterium]|nr:hypothetical protein [Actinomycetota bacterium]